MDSFEDFNRSLTEEVLNDMAESFFGARKQVDNFTDLLEHLAEKCREKGREVASAAGFLNYLLLDRKGTETFYRELSVEAEAAEPLIATEPSKSSLPNPPPSAFTRKGRFIQMVEAVYSQLYANTDEYLHGRADVDPSDKSLESIPASYGLIKNMVMLINEEIRKVNKNMEPGEVMRFVRGFDPETRGKGRITGGLFSDYSQGMNQRLAYQPIEFESFELTPYPELPKPEKVQSSLRSFCKSYYGENKDRIGERVRYLKERYRSA